MLDGTPGAPIPLVWWVSRICEEFMCLPSEAFLESRRLPVGFLEDVIEARAFAAAKQIVDRAQSLAQVPRTPMFDMVLEIMESEAELKIRG